MATAIPMPANTSPDVPDWQALLALVIKLGGGAKLARLTNFENTSEPQVAAGSRFEINGTYFEVTSNESITGWSGLSNGPAFIYAVPSGSTASFAFSATAPTYDTAKGGWFNSANRCLWRLYKGGASIYSSKQEIGDGMIVPVLSTDPASPMVGQVWIRSDL